MIEEARKKFELRRKALESERESGGWWAHWKELSEYILPRHGRFLLTESEANDGTKKHGKVIDGTATYAARVLAAGMLSGISSPARPWFRLTLSDPELADFGPVRWWLDEVQRRMFYVFGKSNLYRVLHSMYLEMGVFGTSAMALLEDYATVVRGRPLTIGEYSIATGSDHRVNTLYRTFSMTTSQMVAKFGIDNVSQAVRTAHENRGLTEKWWPMVHLVEPNDDRVDELRDSRSKPFRSVYYEQYGEHDTVNSVMGYDEFPIMAGRWDTTGTNVYGDSPAMDALADIKGLQKERAQLIYQTEKAGNPPVVAPEALRGTRINGMPGGITYADEVDPRSGLRALYEMRPDLAAMANEIYESRALVNSYFYKDLFLMLASTPDRDMTATEVAQRYEEKILMIGPVIERVLSEIHDPIIDRVFNIMARNELIPPAPQEIQGRDFEVEYVGVLAQAQRMVRTAAIRDVASFVGNLAAADESVLDKFDPDAALEEFTDMVGAPSRILRADDEVEAIRRARSQAEQSAMQMDQLKTAADGAKVLSETGMGEGSALDALMGAQSNVR